MIKRLIVFSLFTFLIAQDQSITNISVGQLTDGSGIVQIYYDLNDDTDIFPSFIITVQVSFDNGENWEELDAGQLNGDFGEGITPGPNKQISYFTDDGMFTDEALIKILGEGHYVTSDIPLSLLTISPGEIVEFESESINYSYEIMQYELTNADLVMWLESFSFDNANNYSEDDPWDDTADAEYHCDDYNNYYNDFYNPGGDADIWGCTDNEALNYNPYATNSNYCDCVYEDHLSCLEFGATNWDDWSDDGCGMYQDCSCSYISQVEFTDEGLPEMGWCPYNDYSDNADGLEGLFQGLDSNSTYNFYTCMDESALNYNEGFVELMNNLGSLPTSYDENEVVYVSCITMVGDDSCVYECDVVYEWDNEVFEDPDGISISQFQTQDISYQGSAFTIDPGKSDHPVRFDFMDCAHSIVLSLYMDHYGLRLPSSGEWMKAARADNERCWPWMDGTCATDSQAYCSEYDCLTSEEQDDCSNEVQSCYNECDDIQDECDSQFMGQAVQCMEDCFYQEEITNESCWCEDEYDEDGNWGPNEACENSEGQSECWATNGNWEIEYGFVYPECEACVDDMSDLQWSLCFSGTGDNEGGGETCFCDDYITPIEDACYECAVLCVGEDDGEDHPCDQYNPNSDENTCVDQPVDFDEDGEIDNPSCFGDYADYCTPGFQNEEGDWEGGCDSNSCWDSTWNCQQDFMECVGAYNCNYDEYLNDIYNCSDCTHLWAWDFDAIIAEAEYNPSSINFIEDLFYNRFNYFNTNGDSGPWEQNDEDDQTTSSLKAVGQYPTGVSQYGLYDVIGNVPELVIHSSGELFITGTTPYNNQIYSFCSDGDWGDENHQSVRIDDALDGNAYYGVRLVRTTTDSE